MRSKYDHPLIGLALGIVFPIIAMFIFYKFNFKTISFFDFIERLQDTHKTAPMLSLSAFSNLIVFFFFIYRKFYFSARGVLIATFIYAGIVIVQKFLV